MLRRKYNQDYYVKHAVKLREYARKYRLSHEKEIYDKLQNILNHRPEWLLFNLAKKRAKLMRLPFTITIEYVQQIIPKVCPITLLPFERGKNKPVLQSMTLDKIFPSLGYVPGNVLVVSRLANTIKQNCTDPEIFDRLANYIERGRCD